MKWYGIGEWWVRTFPINEKYYREIGIDYAQVCAGCQPKLQAMMEVHHAKEVSMTFYVVAGIMILGAGAIVGSML